MSIAARSVLLEEQQLESSFVYQVILEICVYQVILEILIYIIKQLLSVLYSMTAPYMHAYINDSCYEHIETCRKM